jgi:triosephosphate isomerase
MVRPCHAAYSYHAVCHTELGAYAAAIEDAERCIALEPTWGTGYSLKGNAEAITEEHATARPGITWSSLLGNMAV